MVSDFWPFENTIKIESVFITDYIYWKLTNGKVYGLLTTDEKLIQGTYDDNVNMYITYMYIYVYMHIYGLAGVWTQVRLFPMLGSPLSLSNLSDTFKLSEEAKERDCNRMFITIQLFFWPQEGMSHSFLWPRVNIFSDSNSNSD